MQDATPPSTPTATSLRRAALACLLPLIGVGCGDGASGTEAMPDMTQPDMAEPRQCLTPCDCPERGPIDNQPDYSHANDGKQAASSNEDQQHAVKRANWYRTSAGLPAFDGADLINKAAVAHANYLQMNKRAQCYPVTPHSEEMMCAGFTGVSVEDRLTAAGYKYVASNEVINQGPLDAEAAVDSWLWTVYHRLPFLDYKLTETGFGASNQWVMDFGQPVGAKPTAPTTFMVFPVPGQRNVPVDFAGFTESPVPPAPGGGKEPWPDGVSSGTVISIHFPTLGGTVTEHKLYSTAGGTCVAVEHTYFSETDDPNLSGWHVAFLYADEPLTEQTEYVVKLDGTWKKEPFTKTWAFTTQ